MLHAVTLACTGLLGSLYLSNHSHFGRWENTASTGESLSILASRFVHNTTHNHPTNLNFSGFAVV